MKAFASFCQGTSTHVYPWPDPQGSPTCCSLMSPHPPRPISPCPSQATSGLGSSSPQPCPAQPCHLSTCRPTVWPWPRVQNRCIIPFGSFTPSAILYFIVHTYSHFKISNDCFLTACCTLLIISEYTAVKRKLWNT